jgi:hypothetical protein
VVHQHGKPAAPPASFEPVGNHLPELAKIVIAPDFHTVELVVIVVASEDAKAATHQVFARSIVTEFTCAKTCMSADKRVPLGSTTTSRAAFCCARQASRRI